MQVGPAVEERVQQQYADYQAAARGAQLLCINWFGPSTNPNRPAQCPSAQKQPVAWSASQPSRLTNAGFHRAGRVAAALGLTLFSARMRRPKCCPLGLSHRTAGCVPTWTAWAAHHLRWRFEPAPTSALSMCERRRWRDHRQACAVTIWRRRWTSRARRCGWRHSHARRSSPRCGIVTPRWPMAREASRRSTGPSGWGCPTRCWR
jgi:hypothetical protein